MIHIEVRKNQSENPGSVMRRFTKKVQGSGILQKVRSLRYYTRVKSHNMRKRSALTVLERREKMRELFKQGLLKREAKKTSRRSS